MTEPIDPTRVVPISQLTSGDSVRVTLTQHAIFGKPVAVVQNQLVGTVNRVYEEKPSGSWAFHLDLEGLVTTIPIGPAWTVELLQSEPRRSA